MNRFTIKYWAFSFNRLYTKMINVMSDYLYDKNYRCFMKHRHLRIVLLKVKTNILVNGEIFTAKHLVVTELILLVTT